jgi:hypothetical protein
MKTRWTLLAVLLVGCQSQPQEEKEALAALQALSSKTESGITFVNYVEELGNTKAVVDRYKASSNVDPGTVSAMESTLSNHIDAATFWNCQVQSSSDETLRQCQTQQLKKIATKHQSVVPYVKQLESKVSAGYAFKNVDNEKVLSLLWTEAKADINEVKWKIL